MACRVPATMISLGYKEGNLGGDCIAGVTWPSSTELTKSVNLSGAALRLIPSRRIAKDSV